LNPVVPVHDADPVSVVAFAPVPVPHPILLALLGPGEQIEIPLAVYGAFLDVDSVGAEPVCIRGLGDSPGDDPNSVPGRWNRTSFCSLGIETRQARPCSVSTTFTSIQQLRELPFPAQGCSGPSALDPSALASAAQPAEHTVSSSNKNEPMINFMTSSIPVQSKEPHNKTPN
jgi:hypothetical protein